MKIRKTVCCGFIKIFQIFKRFLENKCVNDIGVYSRVPSLCRVEVFTFVPHLLIASQTREIPHCFLNVLLKKRGSTRFATRLQVDTGGSDLVRKYLETLTTFIYFPPSLLV